MQSLWFVPDGTTPGAAPTQLALAGTARTIASVSRLRPTLLPTVGSRNWVALLSTDELVTRVTIERYQGDDRTDLSDWLMSRIDSEVAITIVPSTLASWDYSPRMTI